MEFYLTFACFGDSCDVQSEDAVGASNISTSTDLPPVLVERPPHTAEHLTSILSILVEARKIFALSTLLPAPTSNSLASADDLCELEAWAMQLDVEDQLELAVVGYGRHSSSRDFGHKLAMDAMQILKAVDVYVSALTVSRGRRRHPVQYVFRGFLCVEHISQGMRPHPFQRMHDLLTVESRQLQVRCGHPCWKLTPC